MGAAWRWLDRHAIGRVRLHRAATRTPVRIALGATGSAPDGWTATDKQYLDVTSRENWTRFFRPHAIDAILAEHVWEHLGPREGLFGAKNCAEFLKPTGYMRLAVPDGNHPDEEYLEWVRPGGTGPGATDHRVLYTIDSLTQLMETAGFRVSPLEWFDANGVFHESTWRIEDGAIKRCKRLDDRNADGVLRYTSLIIDAFPV